jgi:hypothetical protein
MACTSTTRRWTAFPCGVRGASWMRTATRAGVSTWNHFNAMAGYANCSIVFMEHYPYYDRLWHGEMFDASNPPEYWLVEMSGIPFGLMSEMLQEGGNPWRGMLFGMTQRWPWSGDPRPLWKAMDAFGITEAKFTGWWDPTCPVTTDQPDVRASVYERVRSISEYGPGARLADALLLLSFRVSRRQEPSTPDRR